MADRLPLRRSPAFAVAAARNGRIDRTIRAMSRPGAVPAKSKPDARRVGILQELSRPSGPVAPRAKVHTDLNKVDFLTKQ